MPILIMIKSTPLWVWLLLAFLIYRGVKSLSPRAVAPWRMFLLPVIFFAWAFMGILTEVRDPSIALTVFIAALAAGGALGWHLARRQPATTFDPANGLVHRPGSATPLVLICIGFITKYALSVVLARRPELGGMSGFCSLYGAVSGLVDGAFWGITTAQFTGALQRIGVKLPPAKLLSSALFGGRTDAAKLTGTSLEYRNPKKCPSRNRPIGSRSRLSKNFTGGIWLIFRG
jgi:Family of unknown function (DUF6622)